MIASSVDAKPPAMPEALPGGNGLTFDWQLIAGLDDKAGLMLSGGLNPANVGDAIALTGVDAVDVSSGVESAPGEKDPQRIAQFIEAARAAFRAARGAVGEREGEIGVNAPQTPNSFRNGPDETGHFGRFGGRFVAETLMPNTLELQEAYEAARVDPAFAQEMEGYLKHYVGRPSPL